MTDHAPSPALFFSMINAYQHTEALKAAIDLNLFMPLASGAKTASELASACEISERGARILADYLSILGFLKKIDDRYELTPDSSKFLNPESPACLSGSTRFLLDPSLKGCYDNLADAVRKGGTAKSEEGTVSHENPIWVDFARGMAPLMGLPAKLLTSLINHPPLQSLRVLDVAAGHGMFGIEFARRYRQAAVTALDWPAVLAVAHENAVHARVVDRFHLLPGSAFETNWGGPYDVVLLTNFLHHFDVDRCEEIARRAYAALAPGGRAITLEFIPDANRISPPETATFALVMLATTAHGDAYTFAEYQSIFSKAGFVKSEFHPLPPTSQQAVVSFK